MTASPVAIVCSAVGSPTTTSPVLIPMRISSRTPKRCSSSSFSRASARAHLVGGADRAQRVVLVDDRHAEDGHHRVADELLDGAAVPLERRRASRRSSASITRRSRLRVDALAEARRRRDVAEQDRDRLADERLGPLRPCLPSLNGASERRKYTVRRLFDTLSDRLQGALGDLRKRGTLDDEAVSRAMREIRLALLEADVNFQVVKQFVETVRERAIGEDVAKSLTPGPAGREDRPRGADRAHGLGQLAARVRGPAADGDPARRPPGLGQDDDGGEARAAAPQGGTAAGARRRGPAAPRGGRAARAARQADRRSPSTRTSAPIR